MAQSSSTRSYLPAAERRAEIVAAASRIGIEEGLERITLRRVAEEIGVRPGLINHYFPEAETLVASAFTHAAEAERNTFFAYDSGATATARMSELLELAFAPQSARMSRLWLNARTLSRYNEALGEQVDEQEAANRWILAQLIMAGVEAGEFDTSRPYESAMLILILIDGIANHREGRPSEVAAIATSIVYASTERELGLPAGALRARAT